MRPVDVLPAIAVVLIAAVLLAPAEGHLFHQIFEVRDNQLTKDYLVVVRLVDYPYEKFDLAEDVYRGEQRVRLKPGGFRTWLRRSMEPGMVFKADYQINRWTGSLESECQRLDRAYGTTLHRRIQTGLTAHDAGAVKAAFREMFFHLIREVFDAMEARLDQREAPAQLYEFLARYFSVSQEAFLNINHPASAVALRAVLDAIERTLGDTERGTPPSPEAFAQQRARFLRTLGQVLGVS